MLEFNSIGGSIRLVGGPIKLVEVVAVREREAKQPSGREASVKALARCNKCVCESTDRQIDRERQRER